MTRYLLGIFVLFGSMLQGQYASVDFNYEKSLFNNGKPLPAGAYFELNGAVGANTSMVEVNIYSEGGSERNKPLYVNLWKRPFSSNNNRFELPINYHLRSDEKYDFLIQYFRRTSKDERLGVKKELQELLNAYIDQNLDYNKKEIRLIKNDSRMVDDMNDIVAGALQYYRNGLHGEFEGFSDMVKEQIEQISDSKQNRFLGKKVSQEQNLELKNKLVDQLKTLVQGEVAYLFNTDLHVLYDSKYVNDYLTEDVQRFLTIHGGYAGVYYPPSDNYEDFGRGFVGGITLPLGQEEFSGPFWSRTSVMAGVFFNNFERNDQLEATGPFVGRPYYLGLGYRFYRFLRLSAGAVVLEDQAVDGSNVEFSDQIYLQPFLSLSVDFNFFIGLAK